RRVSHANSDTESGVETNSVGGASTLSASDLPIRVPITSALGLVDPASVGSSNQNVTGNVIGVNSTSSPAVFPEIELLLKPHPLYFAGGTIGRPSSPSAPATTRHTSSNGDGAGTSIGPVKYLKAPTITTVDHLCRYLTVRVNLQRLHRELTDDRVNFALYTYNEATNTYTRLGSHMSIEELNRGQQPQSPCLDLYYALDDAPSSPLTDSGA
ncbi:hypothetical protein T265_12753, partial [Opisthorchis viverrini]